jgi:hypothetical protein
VTDQATREYTCVFRNAKCRPAEREQALRQIRDQNVLDFIVKVCSMCIKKQYASAKELAVKRRYVVVNTL